MKEKIKGMLPWILTLFAAAMGITAFFLIFAPSVRYNTIIFGQNVFNGLNVSLGYTLNNKSIVVFSASAGMILAYLFPLLGASVAVIGKENVISRAIAAAMFLTGGALSFAATALVKPDFIGKAILGLGSIFSGVTAILAGVAECATCLPQLRD